MGADMSDIVVDTSCLLNFCSAVDLTQFLPATGLKWYVPSAVVGETIYVRIEASDGEVRREEANLQPSLDSGVLTSCSVEGQAESDLYVRLARTLDDGEAMALAIAKSRRWILATDDRKARNQAATIGVNILTTPEILRVWADTNSIDQNTLRSVLRDIQHLACFVPAASAPEYEWWTAHAI
jgi:predicted nucleic acid-binding protein